MCQNRTVKDCKGLQCPKTLDNAEDRLTALIYLVQMLVAKAELTS